jgi:hypothetical protein
VLSTTLFGSGGAIQWQRRQGTLETLIVSPAPFVLVLAPLTLATSTMGVYSVAATLLWGRLLFDVPLELVHPLAFAVSLPVAVISIGLLGLVLASTFVLYRHANALSNLLEYPLWLLCGVLVPLGVLPGWAEVLGRLLSPTWGVEALQKAALGRGPVACARPVRPARCPQRRDRDPRPPALRASGPRSRHPVPGLGGAASMTSVRIFFVGGLIAYRALFNWLRLPSTSRPCSAARCSRSCSSPTSDATPASPTTASSWSGKPSSRAAWPASTA